MVSYIDVPEKCKFAAPKHIDPAQIFHNHKDPPAVDGIKWIGTISPVSAHVSAYKDERSAYEEIQILSISLTQADDLSQTVSAVFRAILYPCLLIVRYSDKFLLSACAFDIGKRDSDRNILRHPALSHWIHSDYCSSEAEEFIGKINLHLNAEGSLKEIYLNILHEIQMFPLGGICSKQYLISIVKWLRGSCSAKFLSSTFATCTPYKKYAPKDSSIRARYEKKSSGQSYTYTYDAEEVWYSLIMEPSTEKIIRARKYRNLEDLIYRMDCYEMERFDV